MRKLHIHRVRTLACFGLAFHCILGQPKETHLSWVETQDPQALMTSHGPGSIRNGETIELEIPETETTLFVIAYLEKGTMSTKEVTIPAGAEDAYFAVMADFDGYRKLSMVLISADPS